MKPLILLSLLLSTNAFSQQNKDSAAIAQLLVDDYKTLGNWDVESHINHCTENYLLVENGEIWDMKKESDYFIKNASRVLDRKNHFDIKYVRVYGNCAYAVYNLRSDIRENGNLKVKNWVETTIFRKVKGTWKIELIDSTPIVTN